MQNMDVLFEKAKKARENAYAPYSNFFVGSCLETANGKLFAGCNVENASYGLTICAESNAIASMITAGEKKIVQMMVLVQGPELTALCGACRQRLNEFATPATLIHLCNLNQVHRTYTLNDLLPLAFGPKDLA